MLNEIVTLLWLADFVDGIGNLISVTMIIEFFGIIGYVIWTYVRWDDECDDDSRKIIVHTAKIRVLLFVVCFFILGVIAAVIPSKSTIYGIAGAKVANQIATKTDIPKKVYSLLDAIEINIRNSAENESSK